MNMFPIKRRDWIYLNEEVMAKSYDDGNIIMNHKIAVQQHASSSCEIIDLQHYKIYHQPLKVKALLMDIRYWPPFVFLVHKN